MAPLIWARLVANAGAPVSPTRSSLPRMLDFLRRRVAFPSGVDECNWRSIAVASGGKGSEPPAMVALDGEVRLVTKFRRPFSRKGVPRESAEVAQTPSQRYVLALYGVTLKERAKGQANCVGGTPARSQTTLVENLGSRNSTDASGPEFIRKSASQARRTPS